MADGTLTPTIDKTLPADVTDRYVTYYGSLAVSAAADTYVAGGVVLSFSGKVPNSGVPTRVEVWDEYAGLGYVYQYIKGTGIADGKLLIRGQQPSVAGAGIFPLDELGAGTAFNAAGVAIDAAVLRFAATFRRLK